MAVAFRASRMQIIRDVIAPQIAPVLLASSRFGVGLIWKMVLFRRASRALGRHRLQDRVLLPAFSTCAWFLAYALSFLFVMLLIEIAIFRRCWNARPSDGAGDAPDVVEATDRQ